MVAFLMITLLACVCTATVAAQTEPATGLHRYLVAQGYKAIALTKLGIGHLVMKASVNGVDGTFILDTGAGGTVIDEK